MTITPFAFVPPNGLRDASYAPTDPPNEAALRQAIQGIPDQLKEYINNILLTSLASTTTSSSGAREIGSETIAPLSGNTVYAQLVSLVAYINSISIGAVPNDSITNAKLAPEVKAEVTQNTRKLKNWIINGGFDVWQRGASQTTSGYASDDRWRNLNTGSTKTHSQQPFNIGQIDVPNNPTYFSKTIVSSVVGVGNNVLKVQKIEDVIKFSNKVVTLSFWAKADANKNISIEFEQNFGSGGSSAVQGLGVQKYALTSTWTKFIKTVYLPSINGKTVGSNSNLALYFWFDAGSNFNSRTDSLGQQSGTFDIANVSLVEGSIAQEWQTETYADVLRQCKRYFEKSENWITSPAYTTTEIMGFSFRVNKRIVPTMKYYSQDYSADKVSLYGNLTNYFTANGSGLVSSSDVQIIISSGLTSGNRYVFFWTADAEL